MGHKHKGGNRFVKFVFDFHAFCSYLLCFKRRVFLTREAIQALRNYKNKHCHVIGRLFLETIFLLFFSILFAKGSINAGIGATGMNVFLTTLNIPWLSKQTYKSREDEAREGILKVTKESCREAVRKEVEAVVETKSTETAG